MFCNFFFQFLAQLDLYRIFALSDQIGEGSDDILGAFTVGGTFNDKPPYACAFAYDFLSNNSAKMDFNGWRESDKGKE